MTYVDGFVIPIKKKNIKQYIKMAKDGRRLWMKHGAVQYFECIGNDLDSKWALPFTKMAKAKPGETVVFSFIVFKSRAHRDQVNKKVMADPFMDDPKNKPKVMPFDMKRMAYGGFKTAVQG